METFIIAQFVGAIAATLEVISYQCRHKKNILVLDLVMTAIYMVQYFLLGAWSGCLVQILVIARTLCILAKDRRKRDWNILLGVFVALYLVVGIVTFQDWYSILPVIASLIFLIAFWKFRDTQKIRLAVIPSKTLWLIYNVCVLSIPGVIANACNIISIGIGLIRYRKKSPRRRK